MIVLDDANLSAAVEAVIQGGPTNGAGQICCAVKRVLVMDGVFDRFLKLLVERCGLIKMGYPSLESTDLGPLISPEAAARVHEQVKQSGRESIVDTILDMTEEKTVVVNEAI